MANKSNLSTSEIILKPSQEQFSIVVKAIPTTGYTWSVESYDKTQFSFEGSSYVKQDASPKIGAPLQEKFTFKLLKPLDNAKEIALKLARSWESKDIKISKFSISQGTNSKTETR